MQFLLAWYLLATLLGWLTFPLAYHLFPALAGDPAFLYKVGIIRKHCLSICCNEQVTISQNKIII